MAVISPTVMEGVWAAMDKTQAERNREYLAGVTMAADMLRAGIIDENDYSALETKYAEKLLPLFRYEKPCFSATLPIRQTDEGRRENGTHYS